jgi:hypothetical protein
MHSETLSHDHLPSLTARRNIIEKAMSHYLAGSRQDHVGAEEKAAAHLLFGVMLDGLRGTAVTRSIHNPAITRHASRFGDGLASILKDALGADVPDALIARCGDRFWATLPSAAG